MRLPKDAQAVLKTVRVVPAQKNVPPVLLAIISIKTSAKLVTKAVSLATVQPIASHANRAFTYLKEIVVLSAQTEHMGNLVFVQLAWMSARLAKMISLAQAAILDSFILKINVMLVLWDAPSATV